MLTLGTFAAGTDLFVIAGILPLIANELIVSVSEAGLLITVFAITYAVASPVLMTVAANSNRRSILLMSLLVFIIGNVLSALSSSFVELLLARVVTALGISLFSPTAYAVSSQLSSEESRGKALAIIVSGFTLATIVGLPMGTFIGQLFGWRFTFWFITSLGLVSLAALGLIFPNIAGTKGISLKRRLSPIIRPDIAQTLVTVGVWTASTLGTLYLHFSSGKSLRKSW